MATTPETSLSAKPASARWLWAVRGAAVISLLVVFTWISWLFIPHGQCSEAPTEWWWVALFDTSPLWLPYLYILLLFRPKTEKSGFRWAVVWGSLMFILSALSLAGNAIGLMRVGVGLFALSQAVMVASALKAYFVAWAEQRKWQGQPRGYILLIVYLVFLFLAAIATPGNFIDKRAFRQSSAEGSMRTVNTAEFTYAETYKTGYSPSLAALGEEPAGTPPSVSRAGLIDAVLALGKKSGYSFVYSPGPKDSAGRIKSYTVVARPLDGSCGTNSYFTDESGVIRQTSDNRPATARDPPLP